MKLSKSDLWLLVSSGASIMSIANITIQAFRYGDKVPAICFILIGLLWIEMTRFHIEQILEKVDKDG